MENNRAFAEMYQAARDMLRGKDPVALAGLAGVSFDGKAFSVPSLGKTYRISYPDYGCHTSISDWHFLTLLHYLSGADGAPVTGQLMAMADMPSGLIRGTQYDSTAAQALTALLTEKTKMQIEASLLALGAKFQMGAADMNVVLSFLPRFPLYLNIWFADEDFPASARLLVDRCAAHYLTIEDAVTAGEVVLEMLKVLLQGIDRKVVAT